MIYNYFMSLNLIEKCWTEKPEWISKKRYLHASPNPSFVGGFDVKVYYCEGMWGGVPTGYRNGEFDLRELGGFWLGPLELPEL